MDNIETVCDVTHFFSGLTDALFNKWLDIQNQLLLDPDPDCDSNVTGDG